jgi:hypothetical protein
VNVKHELTWVCARTACEQLLAQFHDNADAGRATESLGLFTPDAVLDLPLVSARGRDEICQALRIARPSVSIVSKTEALS